MTETAVRGPELSFEIVDELPAPPKREYTTRVTKYDAIMAKVAEASNGKWIKISTFPKHESASAQASSFRKKYHNQGFEFKSVRSNEEGSTEGYLFVRHQPELVGNQPPLKTRMRKAVDADGTEQIPETVKAKRSK